MHKALPARKIMTRDFSTKRKHVEENAFDPRYESAVSRPRNDVVQISKLLHHRRPSVTKKRMLRGMVARVQKSFIKNVQGGRDKGDAQETRRFTKMDAAEKAWLRIARATTIIAIHQNYCIIIYNYCVIIALLYIFPSIMTR